MKRTAIYPGTFDPITFGHIDVVNRATQLFPQIIVVVARNSSKAPLFTAEERVTMIRHAFKGNPKVRVDDMEGLLVDYVMERQPAVIIRGLRAISDFEFEFQMALTNRSLAPSVDTIFLMPDERYTYLNSTIVREVARLGGDVSSFVPTIVQKELAKKLRKNARS